MAFETGHAKNVSNFETLVSFCTGYGSAYNPANSEIELAQLTARLAGFQLLMNDVSTALADQKVEINNRQSEFEGIRKFVTRVVNSLEAGGAPSKDVDDARGFKRKIDGARAETLEPLGEGEEDNSISVSQRSYVQLVEHFTGLINLLKKSTYHPNETELQTTALETKRDAMSAANTAVIDKLTATSNARLERNAAFYENDNSLCEIAKLVKKYVKSVFGADSAQYAQISGLKFTRPSSH